MTGNHARRGMTVIELLTVIAIIAVLAAILLPVISNVRETGRQATCQSNMHSIFMAVSQYRQDNDGEYPPMLLGPAEDASGSPDVSGISPMPIEKMQHAYLYPKYINDISVFHCPDNPVSDSTVLTQALFSQGGPAATFGAMGIAWSPSTQPIPYYAMDSYDITAMPGSYGTYEAVYARDWTGALSGTPTSGTSDAPNQMKYRNAPADQTIITWCNYHAVVSGAAVSIVLLASGTVKPVPATVMAQKGWQFAIPE